MNTLMESHNDGEVWGLDIDNANVFTSGDDNQVKKWDPMARKCIETAIVSDEVRKAKKNRASTLENIHLHKCLEDLLFQAQEI